MEHKQDLVQLDAENCDIFICNPQWSDQTNVLGDYVTGWEFTIKVCCDQQVKGRELSKMKKKVVNRKSSPQLFFFSTI